MRIAALALLVLSLSWGAPSAAQTAPSQPSTQAQPSQSQVQSHDVPEDDDDEDETPWQLYGVAAGFTLFAAVVYLVISRAGRSGKG
ncbi:MAG TPA: hypothetical protein VKR38_17305 [Usitatibacter sp.]|nr:hypothetical protein [Usitatibacter sp.]